MTDGQKISRSLIVCAPADLADLPTTSHWKGGGGRVALFTSISSYPALPLQNITTDVEVNFRILFCHLIRA